MIRKYYENKDMNKDELYHLIRNIKIGDEFYDLKIDGVEDNQVNSILQELAREVKMQFKIKMFFIKGDNSLSIRKCIKYTVISPSKNFLNKKGYWKLVSSKIAKHYLDDYKDKTNYYWNSLVVEK